MSNRLTPKVYGKIDFDSAEATEHAVHTMQNKKCLRDIYVEIYTLMMNLRGKYLCANGQVLEIGSGGGFIKTIFPEVITSDIRPLGAVDLVVNAENLPFKDQELDAIFAVFTLHHIPDVTLFLAEARRVLKPGGGIVCIETYWSPFAKWLYKKVHPEPFDEHASTWLVQGNTPMTSSNQALSYILLKRDRAQFEALFPEFELVYRKRFGFIRYMLTGGIWLKPKLPNFAFPFLKLFEWLITPLMPLLAIHHAFVWRKKNMMRA